MPSAKISSSNKTAKILADAEKGGYGVIAAIVSVKSRIIYPQ